jgi:hypothetical protein
MYALPTDPRQDAPAAGVGPGVPGVVPGVVQDAG